MKKNAQIVPKEQSETPTFTNYFNSLEDPRTIDKGNIEKEKSRKLSKPVERLIAALDDKSKKNYLTSLYYEKNKTILLKINPFCHYFHFSTRFC